MALRAGKIIRAATGSYELLDALKAPTVYKARVLSGPRVNKTWTVVTAAVGELENVALRCEYNNSKNPDIASSPYIRTFYDAIGSFEEDVHQDSTATENPPCLVFEWMETDLRSLSSLQYRDGSPIPKIISKSVLSALESFKRNNIIHTDVNDPLPIGKLGDLGKLLLSCILAKAVWQFYDSKWMQREWTKDTVHFTFERRSSTPKGIFINEPFLSARFDGCHQPRGVDNYRSHLFPKILALGIMFLEIEFAIKIENYWMLDDLGPDSEPTVNADHIAAIDVFNKIELWEERETFGAFRDVIGACLTPDNFNQFWNDVQGLRDAFKKYIVNPLQALYETAWENPGTSHIRVIKLDSSDLFLLAATETARSVSPLPAPLPTPLPAIVATLADHMPLYSPIMQLYFKGLHSTPVNKTIDKELSTETLDPVGT